MSLHFHHGASHGAERDGASTRGPGLSPRPVTSRGREGALARSQWVPAGLDREDELRPPGAAPPGPGAGAQHRLGGGGVGLLFLAVAAEAHGVAGAARQRRSVSVGVGVGV